MTEVKGVIIASTPRMILEKYGQYGLKKWLELISPTARRIYSADINPDAWFPLKEALIEPMANIAQLFFDWDLKKAAWEFGRMSADNRFHGLLKLLVKIPKTSTLVEKAGEYLTGYLIEKSLSVDNICVFLMLFTYFAVPPERQRKVLVLGVLAVVGVFAHRLGQHLRQRQAKA